MRLFTRENPMKVADGETPFDNLNPASLEVLTRARLEPSLATAKPGERLQFERLGYFARDPEADTEHGMLFHRTVGLKDEWANVQKRAK